MQYMFEHKSKWTKQFTESNFKQLSLFDSKTRKELKLELPDFILKSYSNAAKAITKKQKSKEQLDLEGQLKTAYKQFHLHGAKKNSIYWNDIVVLMEKLDKYR